jgi:hypothetical protein
LASHKFIGFYFPLSGPSQGHKVLDFLFFVKQPWTLNVKALELISGITPIGKLNLSSTLALTPSVKWALEHDFNYRTLWLGFGSEFFMQFGTR